MIIRKARTKDLKHLSEMALDLAKYHENLDKYLAIKKGAKKSYEKFFKKTINSKKSATFVAEDKDDIIGFMRIEISKRPVVLKNNRVGLISDAYVVPEYRRKRIALKLLLEAVKWFKNNKIKYIELFFHIENEIGKNAWLKYGFKGFLSKTRLDLSEFNYESFN